MSDLKQRIVDNGWLLERKAPHSLVPEVWAAGERVQGLVRETPLEHSSWLSQLADCIVHLKLENTQVTGSFKARGAVNKVKWLSDDALRKGLVTASTGNHALAFIYACKQARTSRKSDPQRLRKMGFDIVPTIYLPTTTSEKKAATLQAQGARLVFFGSDCMDSELEARRTAEQQGLSYISPYNDPQVAGGQGTIALELLVVLKAGQLDVIFVPVGGGGLMAGIAALLKAVSPETRVVGCQPAASDVMRQSVAAGKVLELPSQPTLSDGTAGGLEPQTLTLEACSSCVDDWVVVEELEIAQAMLGIRDHHKQYVEGAAGVAVACFLKMRQEMKGKRCVIVCCGGNVSEAAFAEAERLVDPAIQLTD